MPRGAQRIATTQMIDAVANRTAETVHQTPWASSTSASSSAEDKIALAAKKAPGSRFAAHIPEKDGILRLPPGGGNEFAARGASIGEQVRAMYQKTRPRFWPVRENLHLSDEQKGKRRQTRGRGRFDTRRKESYIYRPHRWRKIRIRRWFVDAVCAFPAPSRCFALCRS